MKRIFFLTLPVLATGLIALFVAGCGDDDEGNPVGGGGGGGMADSTTFQLVNQQVDIFDFESIGHSIEITDAGLKQAFPAIFDSPQGKELSGKALGADSVILNTNLTYSDEGDWHVFTGDVSITDTEKGQTLVYQLVDSVQFRDGSTVIQQPNESVNTIETRKHFDWWREPDSSVYGDGSHALIVVLSPDPMDTNDVIITLNGSANEFVHSEFISDGAECMLDFDALQTLTNLQFSGSDSGSGDCPLSGSASATASIDLHCESATDTLDIAGSWTVTTTVLQNGDLQVMYDDGVTSWSVTTTCEEAQSGGKNNGNPNDETFEAVGSLLGFHEQWDAELLGVLGIVADSVFSSAPESPRYQGQRFGQSLGADTAFSSLVYNEGSGYWVFTYQEQTESQAAVSAVSTLTAIDSVKFYVGEVATQYPSSPEVVTKIHTAGSLAEDQGSQGVLAVIQDYEITGQPLFGETMIVNGTSRFQLNGNGLIDPICVSQITADAIKTSVYYDLVFLGISCPPSGEYDWTANINVNCPDTTDTLIIADLWSVMLVFDNPVMHITAENSTSRWVVTDTCAFVVAPEQQPWMSQR